MDANDLSRQPEKASLNLDQTERNLYLKLLSQYDPGALIPLLQRVPQDYYSSSGVVEETEEAGAHDVAVWLLDRQGKIGEAFAKVDSQSRLAGLRLADLITSDGSEDCRRVVEQQSRLVEMGTELCRRHASSPGAISGISSEDMWFNLLESQIEMVQSVASATSGPTAALANPSVANTIIADLRTLLQNTFSQLLSQSGSTDVSFPRLFKRLVDSTSASRSSTKGLYTEFRLILTGMLDSYRFEGDFLTLNNRLVQQDLHGVVAESVKARSRGWRPKNMYCTQCQKAPVPNSPLNDDAPSQIRIFRSGVMCQSQSHGIRA